KQALKLHLGRKRAHDDAHPYVAFCENFARLRTAAGFAASTRELDRYLWLTGMFIRWRKKSRLVNEEVRSLSETPTAAAKMELKRMLPRSVTMRFHRYR